MFSTIGAIAAGGAIGAVSRYGVGMAAIKWLGLGFPYGTLIVNILGSFLIGVIIAVAAHIWQPPETLKIFMITGFLGAFTTFSTFSLDVVTLMERQTYVPAGLYIIGSVVLSIGALLGAMALVRAVAA